MDKLRAQLRQGILSATRRHLEARANVMEIVASPGETHRVARSDDSHLAAASRAAAEPASTSSAAQRTSAKRPLRIAPETHRVARTDDSHPAAASCADSDSSSTSSAAQPTSAKRPRVARSDDSHLASASCLAIVCPFSNGRPEVTVQQIFDALPNREELQYDLEGDEQPS